MIMQYNNQLIDELLDDTPLELNKGFKDIRSDQEYLFDLLNGRLAEELVIIWFREKGCKVRKTGCDADGKIVRKGGSKIKTAPDIEVDGRLIEIQISRAGKRKQYHIKESKGKKIKEGKNKLMFVVDDEYFIVDKESIEHCELKSNPAWGGKMTFVVEAPKYLKFK